MKVLSHIRTLFKSYFDKISNERVRNNLLQAIPFWIASLLTGLVAVFYAKFFTYAEQGTQWVLHQHHYWLFLLTPVCFVTAWWVVVQFAKYARGSGIPQVMASIELSTPKHANKVKKMLSLKVIIVKV
ncbi:MAG: chloride channel protein, partial [Bacteroidetes bacterium]|nr:chloride channel protein [Bacteroidota bacterium]